MDDSHKMIAGRQLRGTPHEVIGLLVDAIWLIVNDYRHRPEILQHLADGTLEVNRQIKDENSSRLLPVVSYYNSDIKPINRIQDMICFDLRNKTFVQYYVPSGKGLDRTIKKGFRVYHLMGKTYAKEDIQTSDLIKHPSHAFVQYSRSKLQRIFISYPAIKPCIRLREPFIMIRI